MLKKTTGDEWTQLKRRPCRPQLARLQGWGCPSPLKLTSHISALPVQLLDLFLPGTPCLDPLTPTLPCLLPHGKALTSHRRRRRQHYRHKLLTSFSPPQTEFFLDPCPSLVPTLTKQTSLALAPALPEALRDTGLIPREPHFLQVSSAVITWLLTPNALKIFSPDYPAVPGCQIQGKLSVLVTECNIIGFLLFPKNFPPWVFGTPSPQCFFPLWDRPF